jgi:hypothetical protein
MKITSTHDCSSPEHVVNKTNVDDLDIKEMDIKFAIQKQYFQVIL